MQSVFCNVYLYDLFYCIRKIAQEVVKQLDFGCSGLISGEPT